MTLQEKIKLRDKARAEFEGKEYDGKLIFEVVFGISEYDSESIRFTLFDQYDNDILEFIDYNYDKVLKKCVKPFPKDGFYINDRNGKYKHLASYVCRSLGCQYNHLIEHNIDSGYFIKLPEVTIQELKEEAKRIIEL